MDSNFAAPPFPGHAPSAEHELAIPSSSVVPSAAGPSHSAHQPPHPSSGLAQLKRRRSEIVRDSLAGSLPVHLPSSLFPNLPRPSAGLMPTRGAGHKLKKVAARSFTVADSQFRAKTIFFYKDGDEYFTGVRVPVSKARFRTMDALLDQLNESIPLPFGVRRLHTPLGKTPIQSLEELKADGRYIAVSSTRQARGVDLEAVERRKRRREEAQRRWNFQSSAAASHSSSIRMLQIDRPEREGSMAAGKKNGGEQPKGAEKRPRALTMDGSGKPDGAERAVDKAGTAAKQPLTRSAPFLPVTFRQVFFVLNGHPHRVYRALINPLRKGYLDHQQLLEEVSQGLQAAIFRLYSFDGDRILEIEQLLQLKDMRVVAVPRHEQLLLNGLSHSDILRPPASNKIRRPLISDSSSSLPPINRQMSKSFSSHSHSSKSSVDSPADKKLTRISRRHNDIIRTSDGVEMQGLRRTKGSRMRGRKEEGRASTAQASTPSQAREFGPSSLPPATVGSAVIGPQMIASSKDNTNTADSDSGRPRSVPELEDEERRGKKEEEEKEEEDEGEEEDEMNDDYPPEEPKELMIVEEKRKEKKVGGQGKEKEEEENDEGGGRIGWKDEEEEEQERMKKKEEEEEGGEKMDNEGRDEEEDNDGDEKRKVPVINIKVEEGGGGGSRGESKPMNQWGTYSDELEHILYGEAAVKIQSVWRGYSTRKELKKTRFAKHATLIDGEGTAKGARRREAKQKEDLYKSNERHQAIVGRIKTPMPVTVDSSSDREDASHGVELLAEKKKETVDWGRERPVESKRERRKKPTDDFPYTVTVITGNRWAADTEADLYLVMHGSEGESEKLWLRQEFTNWLHSGPNGQRFRQNQSDSFSFRLPSRLGIIRRLTLGHECPGYGAGLFVDRILVTEDNDDEEEEKEDGGQEDEQYTQQMEETSSVPDCRQFLFLCSKWFDSGQVDGKLERTVRLSAFSEIGSIPVDGRVTRGRWELVLHGGTEGGQGATSSQLAITGYGTGGQATTEGLYDSQMAKVPSEALMQLDFGNIGELLKLRVEIDGTGSSPDYFLNFVEFKDLDTEERFVVMCGKWLRWNSARKGAQPFRELLAFHIGVEPLPLVSYEGKVRMVRPRLNFFDRNEIRLELCGDLGNSGFVRVQVGEFGAKIGEELGSGEAGAENEENGEKGRGTDLASGDRMQDIPFKIEAVSVGRVSGIRVHFEPNSAGEQIFEGLLTMQSIFQRQNVWPLSANSDFVLSRVVLRESTHNPYRYVLTRSQLCERNAAQPQQGTQQPGRVLVKQLLTTEMEGVSTRLPKRKELAKSVPSWLLQMSLAKGSTLLPEVYLCGEHSCAVMNVLDKSMADGMLSFRLAQPDNLGQFIKVRIACNGKPFLSGRDRHLETEGENDEDEEIPFSLVEKVRICDTTNGTELRFPNADCLLQRHSVFELPAIWPDQPPIPILIYSVRVVTGPDSSVTTSSPLLVQLNLFGQLGDVGWRTLSTDDGGQKNRQEMVLFAPNTRSSFEFEAASVGAISSAELDVRCAPGVDFRWECAELIVSDSGDRSAPFFIFRFPCPFSPQCRLQRSSVLPLTDAL